jgi:hypothetical protein
MFSLHVLDNCVAPGIVIEHSVALETNCRARHYCSLEVLLRCFSKLRLGDEADALPELGLPLASHLEETSMSKLRFTIKSLDMLPALIHHGFASANDETLSAESDRQTEICGVEISVATASDVSHFARIV